jgi:hypothetical protein
MKNMYGSSGDLILALPLVLQNLTKFSTAITVSQENAAKVGGFKGRKFGNAAADTALMIDNTAGFFAKLGSDPSAIASGVADKCPAGSTAVIKDCIEMALCVVQGVLESQPDKRAGAKTYAMLEIQVAGFRDISFALMDASLKTEATPGKSFMEIYKYTDSFLEASAYTCPLKKNKARALLQEDEHTEARAAAYHTSAVLEVAAQVTHTILDSHADNSSEATLEALHQAWKPSCELLDCDHTNYFDLFGASHSHSLALIEAGASLQHMRTHIRTRHRLDVRMSRFLSEHGTEFLKEGVTPMYQSTGTRTQAQMIHYYDELRDAILTFAEVHAPTKSDDDLMALIGSKEKIEDFYRSQQGVDIDIAEEHQDLMEEDAEEDMPEESNDAAAEGSADREQRWGRRRRGARRRRLFNAVSKYVNAAIRRRRRRRRRWGKALLVEEKSSENWGWVKKAVKKVAKVVKKVTSAVAKFVASTFACAGKVGVMVTAGYSKKWPSPVALTGVSAAMSISISGSKGDLRELGTFLTGTMTVSIKFGIAFGIGATPFTEYTGGLTTGVGIGGSISCSFNIGGGAGCKIGISVGATAAGKIPIGADPLCPVGPMLLIFKCMRTYGAAVSLMCCSHDFLTAETNCR